MAVTMATGASPSFADNAANTEVEQFIQRHVAALNNKDVAVMETDWTANGTVVDAFPPFEWHGQAPEKQWWNDLQGMLKSAGFTSADAEINGWQRTFVAGDHAYAVANATVWIAGPTVNLKADGTWTFVLHRQNGAWRLASWTWGGPEAIPGKHP